MVESSSIHQQSQHLWDAQCFFARSSNRYSNNFEFGISESDNLDVYIDEKIDNVIKTFSIGELTIRSLQVLVNRRIAEKSRQIDKLCSLLLA